MNLCCLNLHNVSVITACSDKEARLPLHYDAREPLCPYTPRLLWCSKTNGMFDTDGNCLGIKRMDKAERGKYRETEER